MATALAVAVVGGGSWSVHQLGQLETQLRSQPQQAQLKRRIDQSQSDLLAERVRTKKAFEDVQTPAFPLAARSQGAISSFVLRPGLQRSAVAIQQVVVKSSQKIVE